MSNTNIESLYAYVLQQMAAESYIEDATSLSDADYIKRQLTRGTNRPGYPPSRDENSLNQGWPGYTRMTDAQAKEFLDKFTVVHQWSDNPTTGSIPGSRPAVDSINDAGLLLNSQAMLANTGFSATLIRKLDEHGALTNEYTLAMRSTESRSWDEGGDSERDMSPTDFFGVALSGFALAQLDAMEQYYQWLKDNALLPAGATLNVTGYSLGGYLLKACNAKAALISHRSHRQKAGWYCGYYVLPVQVMAA